MKTSISSRVLLSIALTMMLCFSAISSYAQSDPSKEILIYFTKGVKRNALGSLPVNISSAAIQHILAHFKIRQDQVSSAFPKFNEADTLKKASDGRLIKLANMAKIFKVRVPVGVDRQEIIDSLKKISGVLFAEPNGRASVDVVPNDQYFPYQWALQPGGGTGKIQAPEAWEIFQGSTGTKVGIIDQGVDASHPDLSGKVSGSTTIYGYHGTHIAGIAAARSNNTTGVAGVNWNAQILSEPFNDGTSNGDPHLYQIITDAVNQASDVLNSSWKLIYDDGTPGRYSTTVRMAFAYAYKQNQVAVATMGNTGNTTNTVQYPGSFGQGIIAVGATDQDDARVFFSTYGSAIDVSAPGASILSTYRNGITFSDPNYEYLSGTSMAAPFVTGIASLLKGYNPNLYNDDIEHIIQLSADDKGPTGWDPEYGYGRVNAKKALDYLRYPYVLSQITVTGGTDYFKGPAFYFDTYGASGLSDDRYIAYRHEVRRTEHFSSLVSANVWGRGVATSGWSAENPNFGMGYCNVVPGTVTNNGVTLYTYVYEVYSLSGGFLGWYPTTPSGVQFAYTTLGVPASLTASIFGDNYITSGQNGTWTAYPDGGYQPYTYNWWYRYPGGIAKISSINKPPAGYWNLIGLHTQQISRTDNQDFEIKCEVIDNQSNSVTSNIIYVYVNGGLSPGAGSIVAENELIQNFPNPFNPSTEIKYALKEDGFVTIKVYDVLGKVVATLVNENKQAGFYKVSFDASNLSSGVYFYTIKTNDFIDRKKMILLR